MCERCQRGQKGHQGYGADLSVVGVAVKGNDWDHEMFFWLLFSYWFFRGNRRASNV